MTSPYKLVHATVFLLLRFGGSYKQKLKSKDSLATMQAVAVAKVISEVKALQDYSSFVPRFSSVNIHIVGMDHKSHPIFYESQKCFFADLNGSTKSCHQVFSLHHKLML